VDEEGLVEWANAIEGRDDIAVAAGSDVGAVIFDLANPELQGRVTHEHASQLVEMFQELAQDRHAPRDYMSIESRNDIRWRLFRFDRAVGILSLNGRELGHVFMEVSDSTNNRGATSSAPRFDSQLVGIDVLFTATADHPVEFISGTIAGGTPEAAYRAFSELLAQLESSRFLFIGITYDVEWVLDPQRKKQLTALFR
jgi:hypothetical protein